MACPHSEIPTVAPLFRVRNWHKSTDPCILLSERGGELANGLGLGRFSIAAVDYLLGGRMQITIRRLVLVIGVFTLFAACLHGQTVSSALIGTVLDPVSAAVPNAPVTLTETETGATRSTVTDSSGVFRFLDLAPGTYSVTVHAAGFKGYTQSSIVVAANETRDLGKF